MKLAVFVLVASSLLLGATNNGVVNGPKQRTRATADAKNKDAPSTPVLTPNNEVHPNNPADHPGPETCNYYGNFTYNPDAAAGGVPWVKIGQVATVLATVLMAVFTAVLIRTSYLQWHAANNNFIETRKAADAANKSAESAKQAWDSAKRIDRAWIMTDPLSEPQFVPLPDAGPPPLPVQAIYTHTNYGKTPAFIVELGCRFRTLLNLGALEPEPDYRNPNAPKPLITPKPDLGVPLLSNKMTPPLGAPLEPRVLLTQPEIDDINKGNVVLYAYGFIKYRDVFDDLHETRWGYVFLVPTGFSTYRGWQMAGPDAYNWHK